MALIRSTLKDAGAIVDVQAYGGNGTITVSDMIGKKFTLVCVNLSVAPTVTHNGTTINADVSYPNQYHDGANTWNVYQYEGDITTNADTFTCNSTAIWYVIITD